MENPEKSIKRLLHRPEVEKMNMPKDYLMNARFQYQNLLLYLKKLKEQYPDEAKTLQKKKKPETKAHTIDFTQDKEIFILCRVLQMTEAKEEWNELHNLLNARFLLKELQKDNHPLPTHHFMLREQMAPHTMKLQKDNIPLQTHQSMHTEKMTPHTTKSGAKESTTSSEKQTMGTVLGSEFNNPTHQNIEGRHPSQSYTKKMTVASGMPKDISDLQETQHGFQVEPGRQKPEQPTKTGKSEIQQRNKTDKPGNQQTDGEANSLGMSKNISDPQKTFQRFPQESRRHKPEQSTGKHEYQQTDLQKDNHPLPTHQSKYTEKMTPHTTKDGGHGAIASPTSSDRQTMGIVLESDNNPTRQNIEGRHPSQSYTKGMAIASDMSKNISDPQKTYHGFPELGREKPEWATKTGKSEIQPTVKAGKSERQQTDSTSGDIINVESEVERPLFLLLSRKRSSEAEKEYQRLLDNHKEMFKDRQKVPTNKTWETSTDIDDIKEEQKNKKEKGLIKTAYEKDFDSMEIPRKSYEDLQNELVEKNKQIDELTSRLRDIETKRADLSGKPLKNKSTDGML